MPPALHHRRQIPEWIASIEHLPIDDEPFILSTSTTSQPSQHVVQLHVAVHQRLGTPAIV